MPFIQYWKRIGEEFYFLVNSRLITVRASTLNSAYQKVRAEVVIEL